MSTINIKLKNELIKEWVKSIARQDLINLLKNWNFQVKEEHFSKFELFKKAADNKLTNEQFLEFWLLKEIGEFKNRNWVFFRYDSSSLEKFADINLLKDEINQKLTEELNANMNFNLIVHKFENKGIYIVFTFKGSPQILEEFGFKFQVHNSIQRVRCLLGYNNIIQISSFNKSKTNLCLKVLRDILDTKIEDVPIYSYAIRDFIQQMKPIEKIVIVCPREMGGFSGVERITIEGPKCD